MAEPLENAPAKLSASSQETSGGEETPSSSADAQPHMNPPVNRFLVIRKFLSKPTLSASTPQFFENFSTYRIELLKERCKGNLNDRIPPPHIVGDLLQVDIDEEGDVGFLAGPSPFDRFTPAKTSDTPTQYIFRLGKSLKSVDCIGAWGFSEIAKKRLLEASLKPSRRTLGSFDASREDGVTIVPELQDENEKEEDVREVAGLSSQPELPKEEEQKEEVNREREVEEVAELKNESESLDEPLRHTTPRYRTEQINYDIPPAPMPPPVDPAAFEGFNPILPPEPDTPLDDLKNSRTPSPSRPESRPPPDATQVPSPSALDLLFSSPESDDTQTTHEASE
ncbi:hypothetical protein FRC00_004939 [Tulasnella sp. 408]|nr:hypothetical protein FRC00_004939 [Tulasnella sp. 408]